MINLEHKLKEFSKIQFRTPMRNESPNYYVVSPKTKKRVYLIREYVPYHKPMRY